MDGVSWSATRAQESFSRSRTATDTLSRLATFIARADPKAHTPTKRQQPEHAHTYVCPECAQDFLYAPDLLHHQEVKHSLPKPHRCPSCGREFSLRSSLQLHKCDQDSSMCDRCHGDSQPASPCPACGTRPSDAGRLQDASAHLVDSSPYACAPCGRSFSQKQALLQHQQAGCGEPPPPSDIVTSPPVSEADSTRSDSSDAPGPSSRVVRVCLQRHKLTGHSEQQLTAAQGPNAKGSGSEGGGAAPNRALVKMPRSKKKLLTCRSCDMVFGSTSLLYVHRKDKHSRERELVVEPRPVVRRRRRAGSYPCPVCGKVLVHHLSLRAHLKQHTDPGPAATGEGRPLGASTKDSEASEDAANQVRTSEAENRSVKPGRGRPRKVPRLENRVTDAGRCREVPEEEVKEEEEEEEEEALEKEFPCPSCAEVFPLQSQLREHVELHQSSVKRRQCSVCTDEMDTCKWPGSKRQRLYHCVPCQQGFSALDSFLEHCQEHLRVRVEEDSKA